MSELERVMSLLTQPVGGQFPRPWMTDLQNPESANVFVIGKNQANGFEISKITHKRHLDALFNRGGESCRGLYDEITGYSPSPTRTNTDRMRSLLKQAGVDKILETNVVCFSTPMSADLKFSHNISGAAKGKEIFAALLSIVKPKVLIVHGAGASKELSAVLNADLPTEPKEGSKAHGAKVAGYTVFVIPSLAPPAFNKWSRWSGPYLQSLAKEVAKSL
ncbi:MAG: hypothetical protein A3H44_12420 [Gammaproteobacteria bacterium RIFCSPLOWO2_02_FULL_57_10]|nr:MAG: hypothetical protein A3H44_12420 [Gammaproteobacteria bacterium RIFCSPLOWO2_02_FULL_57_10]